MSLSDILMGDFRLKVSSDKIISIYILYLGNLDKIIANTQSASASGMRAAQFEHLLDIITMVAAGLTMASYPSGWRR